LWHPAAPPRVTESYLAVTTGAAVFTAKIADNGSWLRHHSSTASIDRSTLKVALAASGSEKRDDPITTLTLNNNVMCFF